MLKDLKNIGLTDGESRAYLSLLKLGSSTVGPIVKESRISYSKIYEVLGRLLEKGLINYNIKDKTKYFQAINPTRLLDFIEQKENEIIENKNRLKKIIPNLERIGDRSTLQEAEIFLGTKGLRTAYKILLEGKSKKEFLLFFYLHDEEYAENADFFYQQEFYYFKKEGIKLRGIATSNFKESKFYKRSPNFVDLKFVDFPLPSMVDIFNGKILLTMWRDKPIGILIQSREVYENYKNYFEELWKIAKS